MKIYSNTSRLGVLRRYGKRHFDDVRWALALKHGDIVNACGTTYPFNAVVDKLGRVMRMDIGHHGWVIYEVEFFTTDGCVHSYPGSGGCVQHAYSLEKIRKILTCDSSGQVQTEEQMLAGYEDQAKQGWLETEMIEFQLDLFRRAIRGDKICTEQGLMLPDDYNTVMMLRKKRYES